MADAAPLLGGGGAGAASAVADPFYMMRDQLTVAIASLRTQYSEWRSQVDSLNTATDIGFRLRDDEFRKTLAKTEDAVAKVRKTLEVVTKSRAKFAHIDDRELASRADSLVPLEQAVRDIKALVGSAEVRGKFDSDKSRELVSRTTAAAAASAAASTAYGRANTEFVAGHRSEMVQIRRQQDEAVADLGNTLSRVAAIATTIKTEVEEQDVIIEHVTRDVDTTQSKMDSATAAIEKLLKTKDRCQLITICSLILAFIIVAIVAFYLLTKK